MSISRQAGVTSVRQAARIMSIKRGALSSSGAGSKHHEASIMSINRDAVSKIREGGPHPERQQGGSF